MNRTPHNTTRYAAVDISKDKLDVCDDHGSLTVANSAEGIARLLERLAGPGRPLVVFEATGGYERLLIATLRKKKTPLVMVNPARVRAFANSEGVKAKTDPIDARMILKFARSKALRPLRLPSPSVLRLAALLDRRAHLVEELSREKNRLQNSDPLIHRSIKRMIRIMEKEVAAIEAAIEKTIDSKPQLRSAADIIQSIKGVGRVTAWHVLAYLDEIGQLNRNRLVALAGVAPFNRDSGKSKRRRSIQGGRAKLRKTLYMAAHTAARSNPVIKPYVRKLRERGKPYKCAIVAAMRKLLIHIQSLLKKSELFPC